VQALFNRFEGIESLWNKAHGLWLRITLRDKMWLGGTAALTVWGLSFGSMAMTTATLGGVILVASAAWLLTYWPPAARFVVSHRKWVDLVVTTTAVVLPFVLPTMTVAFTLVFAGAIASAGLIILEAFGYNDVVVEEGSPILDTTAVSS